MKRFSLALFMRNCLVFWGLCLASTLGASLAVQGQEAEKFDWRNDWELPNGFTMDIDTEGYFFPSQIVFVPNPGPGPKDPLYFVVELKGTIKVVTNDRTVHTFATDLLPIPQSANQFIQAGTTSLCLDTVNGYVFATFAYRDETLIFRNGMVRLSSQPETFGVNAEGKEYLLDLFKDELAAESHMIGPCQVHDSHVYVAVGYGEDRTQAQNLHSTLGSIIRMTPDFEPASDNPFYKDDGKDSAVDYIWAYGVRNPFGLKFVGDRLFATENGGAIDRFNEIRKGENYLWDGTDWGIGARAAQVFAPSVGLVHLEYIPEDSTLFPEVYLGHFLAPASGPPGSKGPAEDGKRSVLMWRYDFDKQRMAEPPQYFLRYRGKQAQIPVSITLGHDGLYFVALLPNEAGNTPVYKITYDPEAKYPHHLGSDQSPTALISKYGCRRCHEIAGRGGDFGPPLDKSLTAKLTQRLNSPDYEARVSKVDKIDLEPFTKYRQARADVLAATGKERVQRWLPVYLQEPRFDNPEVKMASVGVTSSHAQILAEYLLQEPSEPAKPPSFADRARGIVFHALPEVRYRHLAVSFLLGVLVTIVLVVVFRLARKRSPKS